jgi:putative holliday junction resolvase
MITPIDDLLARYDGARRLAGLDLGTKTIGIAISDVEWRIATPNRTIRRTKFTEDVKALLALLDSYSVMGIVLGLPLNMDGSEGPRVQATRAFARNLGALTPMLISVIDERLTTAEAERAMIAADRTRKQRAESIDAAAAAIILQTALDRIAFIARAQQGG